MGIPVGRLLLAGVLTVSVPLYGRAQTPAARPAQTAQPQAAQTPVEEHPPDTDYAQPVMRRPAALPATGFLMPDVPDAWNDVTAYDGPRFSTRFSFVPIVDFNAFVQDDESRAQVGDENNEWDLRTTRFIFRGQVKFAHPIDYLISIELKGKDHFDSEIEGRFGFADLEIATSVGKLGKLKFGKIKEPFIYEMVGDAANLQQQERALSPFFRSRGIGLRLGKTFADDSMSWSVGWFNDWWVEDQQFDDSGNDFVGRLTGLPYWTDDGSNYLHLAASGRYVGADEGTLRFRGRPESNVTNYFVDSESLVGDYATELGLESAWGRGPFFLTGEYAHAWVDASDAGNPRFWGMYLVLSYVLTGEHRPYDKKAAYARRVLPQRQWGAWEVVGRYSHVDVEDRLVDGGIFDRSTIGLNWWATRRWKIGFDYGLIELDRAGLRGTTHTFRTRFQWAY